MDNDIAIKIVPTHLPKIKPEARATGEPKPSNKTQIITKKKNTANNKK